MRYVAAYLLAVLGGKETPAAADIEKILSSVGIEVDKEKLTKVINELKGKNVEELMEKGKNKFIFQIFVSPPFLQNLISDISEMPVFINFYYNIYIHIAYCWAFLHYFHDEQPITIFRLKAVMILFFN